MENVLRILQLKLMKINRSFVVYVLIVMLVAACQASALPVTSTPVSTAVSTITPASTSTRAATPIPTITATPQPVIQRVIILSMDGLRPEAIELAPMPNLLELMKTSAYSLTAQTTRPSATLPSHASMLTGMCPSNMAWIGMITSLKMGLPREPICSTWLMRRACGL